MNQVILHKRPRVRPASRRRFRHYFPYCVVMVCVIAILVVAEQLHVDWRKLLFAEVVQVRIGGEYRRIDIFEVERLLSASLSEATGRAEIEAIAKRLEGLPWIQEVIIQRNWLDNTLSVAIREREAVAYWGKAALLDANGELFIPRLIDDDALPVLDAALGREKQVFQVYRQLSDWLAPIDLRIVYLKENHGRSYSVRLENAPSLILGRRLFEQRIKRFVSAYKAGFADYIPHVACIDLRYATGFAVRWRAAGETQLC